MVQRVSSQIAAICEDVGFDPIITPILMDIGHIERSGKFDEYGPEFYIAGNMVMSATSEEYLLALTKTGRISHSQLPIRMYETKDAFRNVKRPKGILKTRQFGGIITSSLEKNKEGVETTLKLFGEIMSEISRRFEFALTPTVKF